MEAHNSIRRYLHRIGEECRSTAEIARFTSWPEALETFRAKVDIQVMNRNGFKEQPSVRKRLIHKHEILMKYFEKRYGDFYGKYDFNAPMPVSDPALENKIWVCWWQGLDNAPLIVQRCVESIRRNAGNREVIVITDENYEQYVHIPDWVKAKQEAGIITRTNLSDLLRLSLLAEHGGLWLDSTFYCSGPLEKMVFSKPLGPSNGLITCIARSHKVILPVILWHAMLSIDGFSEPFGTSFLNTGGRVISWSII